MRTIDQVPKRLWRTPCPLCVKQIDQVDAEAEDGVVQLTFYRGEWRLVHTDCLTVLHGPALKA